MCSNCAGASSSAEHTYQVMYGDMSEVNMFKLLAVSTRIVQILKQGLSTFNCMRFKKLTDQITIMIKYVSGVTLLAEHSLNLKRLSLRKTVQAVSKFWLNCKNNLNSEDQALILRLQVEYDHFILRAVTTILASQRSGVWKFISVIPYDGVTGRAVCEERCGDQSIYMRTFQNQ